MCWWRGQWWSVVEVVSETEDRGQGLVVSWQLTGINTYLLCGHSHTLTWQSSTIPPCPSLEFFFLFVFNNIFSIPTTALTWTGHQLTTQSPNFLESIAGRCWWRQSVSQSFCVSVWELSRQSCHVTPIWFYTIVKDLFWVTYKGGGSICSDCSDCYFLLATRLENRREWTRLFDLNQDLWSDQQGGSQFLWWHL